MPFDVNGRLVVDIDMGFEPTRFQAEALLALDVELARDERRVQVQPLGADL